MGKTQKAPMAYQPTGQGAADQSYQNLTASAQPWATELPQQVVPGLQQAAGNVMNNPYTAQAQQGANAASQAGQGVASNLFAGGQNLQGLGNLASYLSPAALQSMGMASGAYGAGQQTYNQAGALMPQTTGGSQYADPLLQNLTGMIPGTTQAGTAAAPYALMSGLAKGGQAWDLATQGGGMQQGMDAAGQVLNTGFDPQSALYNRNYQQQMDQTNALNAMYGVSGSPYGAGVAQEASKNFNLDWNDRQLQRQISALGAYGTEQGAYANMLGTGANAYEGLSGAGVNQYTGLTSNAASNAANLTNAGVGAYTGLTSNAAGNFGTLANAQTNAMRAGTDNYRALMSGGVNDLSQLAGTAGSAYQQAGQQGVAGLNTLTQSANAPNQAYLAQQQAQIAALQSLAQGTGQALAPGSQLASDQAKYLGIGQNATKINQEAVAANNAAASASWGAVGQLAGGAASLVNWNAVAGKLLGPTAASFII